MKPVAFPEQTVVLAPDQKGYDPLPVHATPAPELIMVSCWRLGWRERLKLLLTGRLWLMQRTLGHPLQPSLITADRPFVKDT